MLRSEIEVPASCRADQQVCLLGGSDQHEGNVYIAGKQNRNMYFLSTVWIFVSFTVNRLTPQIFYLYFFAQKKAGFHMDMLKLFCELMCVCFFNYNFQLYKVRNSHVHED